MRRAESFLIHVRCKYMWAAYTYTHTASLFLSYTYIYILSFTYTYPRQVRFVLNHSERLTWLFTLPSSVQDTRVQSSTESRRIKLCVRGYLMYVMTLPSHNRSSETGASTLVTSYRTRITDRDLGTISRCVFHLGIFILGKLLNCVLPFEPII